MSSKENIYIISCKLDFYNEDAPKKAIPDHFNPCLTINHLGLECGYYDNETDKYHEIPLKLAFSSKKRANSFINRYEKPVYKHMKKKKNSDKYVAYFKGVKDTYDEAREKYVILRGQYKATYAINKVHPSYFRDENYILDFKGSEAQLAR